MISCSQLLHDETRLFVFLAASIFRVLGKQPCTRITQHLSSATEANPLQKIVLSRNDAPSESRMGL